MKRLRMKNLTEKGVWNFVQCPATFISGNFFYTWKDCVWRTWQKKVSEISYNALLLSYREISFIHEKTAYEELDRKRCLKFRTMPCYFPIGKFLPYLKRLRIKNLKKGRSAVPSCSRYLARAVLYKFRLNSWNIKHSQNVTCVCNLECPIR